MDQFIIHTPTWDEAEQRWRVPLDVNIGTDETHPLNILIPQDTDIVQFCATYAAQYVADVDAARQPEPTPDPAPESPQIPADVLAIIDQPQTID